MNLRISKDRGNGKVGEMDEVSQKVQTFSYKINKPWECNVQHGDCSQ